MSSDETDEFEHCYQAAFEFVFSKIEGLGHINLAEVYEAIRKFPGSTRLQTHALMIHFDGLEWSWPEYERNYIQKLEAERHEIIRSIQNLDTAGTLGRLRKDQLVEIHRQLLDTPLKKSVLIRDLISSISTVISSTDIVIVKQGLIDQLPPLEPICRRKLAEFVASKTERTYFALRHFEQLSTLTEILPYRMLHVDHPDRALEACRHISLRVRHWSEPCWQTYPSPCPQFECSCNIEALSERKAGQNITGSPI